MTTELGIDEYLHHLRVEKGLAAQTVSSYRLDLRQYVEHLAGAEPTSDLLSQWIESLAARGLAATTLARKLAAVRGLHRFRVAELEADADPTALVDSPRRGSRLPKALTVEQVLAMLDAERSGLLGRRNQALLEFLYATGARVSETVSADLADIDLEELTTRLIGKGGRHRVVLLGRPAALAIESYLPQRRELIGDRPDPGTMFVGRRGRPLTRQRVWQVVKRAGELAGIEEPISPHTLRHSAATHMVEGGADLRSVQELLGHASISTTQVYTRVSARHLREIYIEAHPRSR